MIAFILFKVIDKAGINISEPAHIIYKLMMYM